MEIGLYLHPPLGGDWRVVSEGFISTYEVDRSLLSRRDLDNISSWHARARGPIGLVATYIDLVGR